MEVRTLLALQQQQLDTLQGARQTLTAFNRHAAQQYSLHARDLRHHARDLLALRSELDALHRRLASLKHTLSTIE